MGYNEGYDVLCVLWSMWQHKDRTPGGYVDDVLMFVFGDLSRVDDIMATYIHGKPRNGTLDQFPNASPERILSSRYFLKKHFGKKIDGATLLGSV